MITIHDCIGLCDLTPEEVAAIAEHEHVPEMVATTLGAYLLHRERGAEAIRDMLLDDIRAAMDRRDVPHVGELVAALGHFLQQHPDLPPC